MDVELLIAVVKEQPILYTKQTGTIEQKNAIWKEIADKVQQPVEKCKAKWRNLRDSYLKAIKWKQELESVNMLRNYRPYIHEQSLNFIEDFPKRVIKRKGNDSFETSKKSKKQKIDYSDTEYSIEPQDYSSTHAVEYLIETDRQESIKGEDDEDDGFCNSDEQTHESADEEIVKTQKCEPEEQTFYAFDATTGGNVNVSIQPEEITYRESFLNETPHAELDSWLLGIKDTISSFPKLLRAKAKKQINDLVSDFEIKYLESLDS